MLRVLVHDYAGNPLHFDVSRALATRHHLVLHAFSAAYRGPQADFAVDRQNRLTVVEIPGPPVARTNLARRYLDDRRYGRRLVHLACRWRPDLVLCSNTPLDAQRPLMSWAVARGVPVVHWATDLRHLAALSILRARLGPLGGALGAHYRRLEAALMRQAAHVVCLVDRFVPVVRAWGVPARAITLVPPWGAVDDIRVLPRDNAFARSFGLVDKFVVLYAGTLGLKQDPDLIADAAHLLRAEPEVRLVVVSEGSGARRLAARKAQDGLDNLVLIPFQPYGQLSEVLATGDVLLTVLQPFASEMSVPSKVWTGLCAGRPALLALPPDNMAARVVIEAGAGRMALPYGPAALAREVRWFMAHPAARQAMGHRARDHAVRHFRTDAVADRFATLFQEVMARAAAAQAPGRRQTAPAVDAPGALGVR